MLNCGRTEHSLPQTSHRISLGRLAQNFFNTLVSGSGRWRLDVVSHGFSSEPHWGIILDSPTVKIHPMHLVGRKPRYRLYLILGDPDCGDEMILKRTE